MSNLIIEKTGWRKPSALTFPRFILATPSRVHVRIKEGDKERLQAFEGVVIKRDHGPQASFTVRKISFGQGVERIFPVHSKSDRQGGSLALVQSSPRQTVLSPRPQGQSGASARRRKTQLNLRLSAWFAALFHPADAGKGSVITSRSAEVAAAFLHLLHYVIEQGAIALPDLVKLHAMARSPPYISRCFQRDADIVNIKGQP